MTARQRSAGLALLLLCGGLLAATLDERRLLGALPVPARPLQRPALSSPEPPLADAPAVPPSSVGPGPALGSPCPVDPPVPSVTLRVRVPASAPDGQELEYHLFVENHSRSAAHHVLVRNPLPANARFVRATPEPSSRDPELQWQLRTLEPGACREIVLVLLPLGAGDLRNCARVQFEYGECVCTHIGNLAAPPPASPPPASPPPATVPGSPPGQGGLTITKQVLTPQAPLHEAVSFRLVVRNTGNTPLTGVSITDTLPAGLEPLGARSPLTWDVGTLEPGGSRSEEYQVIGKEVGRWVNRAVATSAAGDRQEATASVVVVDAARLELTNTGPQKHFLNSPATYQLTVINSSTTAVTHVVLTDLLPEKTELVSASDNGQRIEQGVQWSFEQLPPGGRRTVRVVLRAKEAGEVVNRAVVRADRELHAEKEARTRFEGGAGLGVQIDKQDDPIEVAARTKYTITVTNQGDVPATNVVITARVPEEMEVTEAGPGHFHREERNLTFDALTVPPHESAVYEVSVKTLKAGDVRFQVDLTADQLPGGPVREEESTTIYDPNISPKAP